MKIALASDHAGFAEKEKLKPLLRDLGLQVEDLGTLSEESVDYPDYARKVAEQVAEGTVDQGLLADDYLAHLGDEAPLLQRAVSLQPELLEAHYQLSRVLVKLKRPDEANRELAIFKQLTEKQKTQNESREIVRRLANVRF